MDRLIEAMEGLIIAAENVGGEHVEGAVELEAAAEEARAALEALQEQRPAAWLITDSRTYQDAVVISEHSADQRITARGGCDGSRKVPLYAAPQPEEAP